MNEDQFISELKRGSPSAFAMLVDLYGDKIFNTVIGIVQHKEDAEDLTQEIFSVIFQSINVFKGESKLSTWIYKISVTKSLEFLRKKKSKKRFGIVYQLFGEDSLDPITELPTFLHPGIQLENKERAIVLFAAIDKLSDNQKTAFILHKLEDLSYAEIAEIMSLSISSIESLLFRAKQNLQKLLKDYYEKNEK